MSLGRLSWLILRIRRVAGHWGLHSRGRRTSPEGLKRWATAAETTRVLAHPPPPGLSVTLVCTSRRATRILRNMAGFAYGQHTKRRAESEADERNDLFSPIRLVNPITRENRVSIVI